MKYIGRLIETVRPLSVRQILTRARHVARRHWWDMIRARRDDGRSLAPGAVRPLWREFDGAGFPSELASEVSGQRAVAAEIAAGRFRFLNLTVEFGTAIDWHTVGVSQLWRYHLHSFDYVRSLWVAQQSDGDGFRVFTDLVRSWNAANCRLQGDGWHPYTLSLRTANWLQCWAWWRPEIEAAPDFCASFLGSLSAQGRMLARQLEFDVRGNHLLKNVRALLWFGIAFTDEEARRWFDRALACLEEETQEQVLADGGHFERTPGYHVVILRDYLEMSLLLERNAGCPSWLRDAVRRQAEFLRGILGPAERLPLVKDTTFDLGPATTDLLNAAAAWLDEPRLKPVAEPGLESYLLLGPAAWRRVSGWPAPTRGEGPRMFRDSGFLVLRGRDGEHVFIDAGKPCPDYLPAHAHADTFSYEYQSGGQPVVVDSGVYEYQHGVWRDYFRSTRAHNTLEIEGANSSEVWASFRVGRRARPRMRCERLEGRRALVLVEHDGYRHLSGRPVHRRAFIWHADEYLLIVDEVTGRGSFTATSHVHFHPSLQLLAHDRDRWQIRGGAESWWLGYSAGLAISSVCGEIKAVPQGWYSERFGQRVANAVIALRQPRTVAPFALAYAISRRGDLAINVMRHGVALEISIIGSGLARRYTISEDAINEFV